MRFKIGDVVTFSAPMMPNTKYQGTVVDLRTTANGSAIYRIRYFDAVTRETEYIFRFDRELE